MLSLEERIDLIEWYFEIKNDKNLEIWKRDRKGSNIKKMS